MTFSNLISGTIPHHNKFSPRSGSIVGIIQHHWAVTTLAGEAALASPKTKKSVNYLVYSSGICKGQVPEEYRAWTSGSMAADGRRITIECQNETGAPDWRVSAPAVGTITALIADIAKRRGFASLNESTYQGHRQFAATACPGPYLWSRMPDIRASANVILLGSPVPLPPVTPPGHLDVDGKWGKATTTRQQQRADTGADGEIWHQWKSKYNENIYSAKFDNTGTGSPFIKWCQTRLQSLGLYGGKIDGLCGHDTNVGFQKFYGTPQDGIIDPVSTVVKAMQTELNTKNTFLGI